MSRFLNLCYLFLFCTTRSFHFVVAERVPFSSCIPVSLDTVSSEIKQQPPPQHKQQYLSIPRGGSIRLFPAGWHPMGYKITTVGETFLSFDGSLDSDVGRFLGSLKKRVTKNTLKAYWLEIVRVAKTGQSMRIYRQLDQLIQFCSSAGFIN